MKKLATTFGLLALMLVVTSFTTPVEIGGSKTPGNGTELSIGGSKTPGNGTEFSIGGSRTPIDNI
ncbi:MAG: hypothetical protein RL705_773 [Bacteroidota bacterium]